MKAWVVTGIPPKELARIRALGHRENWVWDKQSKEFRKAKQERCRTTGQRVLATNDRERALEIVAEWKAAGLRTTMRRWRPGRRKAGRT